MIRRTRLIGVLETGVRDHRLVLVSAPAGYGKSSLLADWARETNVVVTWLALGSDDSDPERFFRYMLKAWAHVQPDVVNRPVGVLLSGTMPGIEPVIAALLDTAAELDGPIAFVLDDYHAIEDPAIHDAMSALIERLSPSIRFVIGSRETPPLPIARWRARRDITELGPAELRLRADEAESFLNERLGLSLTLDAVARLNERTEGWFAGLQLAALTIDPGSDSHATVSGRHRFIADYVREDVLNRLPPETRDFLVRTSIVDTVCAPLADAITSSNDGQTMLERLERENLFTVPLDDNREWFRYHRLFADVLRDELMRRYPHEVEQLHRRAATWYLHEGQPEPAFNHSMSIRDVDLVTLIFERFALLKLFTGQHRLLKDWVQQIPEAWIESRPLLRLLQVAVWMYTGSFDIAVGALDDLHRHVIELGDNARDLLGRVTAVKCFIACEMNDVPSAEEYAAVALAALSREDHVFRGGVWGALGDVYRRNGRWNDAHAHYLQSLPYSGSPAGLVQSVSAYGALADLELRQGRLHSAAGYWRKALTVLNDEAYWGSHPLPLIGWVHTRHGEILYEWNDLSAAQLACDYGQERALLGGDPRSIIASGLLETRLHLARGELVSAETAIERVQVAAADTQFPEWRAEMERYQVELWLAMGRQSNAITWSEDALSRAPGALPDQEPVTLAIARVLIAKGDGPAADHALRLLDPLIAHAEAEGRAGLHIAALGLRSLAYASRGDIPAALTAVERALNLGEPEKYIRSFVDLGLPFAGVLQHARKRGILHNYVDSLLGCFTLAMSASLPGASTLPEPLSVRELEVLRLVAAGLSNREIASSLFISPETVKKHAGSIYGKLGVGNRTEAVARSRELDLLD